MKRVRNVGFITTVMSFLPRERHDVKRIMLLSKKALEKKEREKVNGKRTQLNVTVDSETMDNLEKLEKKLGKNKFEVVIEAVKLLHRFHIRKSRSPSQGLGIKPDQMGSNQTDDKRHLRQNRSLRNSAWNEKASRSTNEIQDAPHPSILLDSVSENGVSTVPPEVPQSYQPPTSAELPASEEVDEAASPRPTALQTLGDNLG